MYGDETRFEKFLYLGCYVGVLEVILEGLRVLLHLFEDAAHGGVAEDGLHIGVGHGAFSDLGRELVITATTPNCLIIRTKLHRLYFCLKKNSIQGILVCLGFLLFSFSIIRYFKENKALWKIYEKLRIDS